MNIPNGFGIIEIIVAIGIFIIIATTGIVTVTGSYSTNRLGDEHTKATLYAQEGLEAARAIKNRGWADPFLATNCTTGCGVSSAGGFWVWSGTNNTQSPFTRTITVTQARRTAAGTVVTSGGVLDPDMYRVVSTVTWQFSPTRNNTVSTVTYLSNFVKSIIGDWSNPSQQSAVDLSGTIDGLRVVTEGNYAYVVRASGTSNFSIVNVSNPAAPAIVSNLTLTGNLTNIFVSGTRAYVTSSNNSGELYIINIANPAAPTLLGTYNASGNDDGNDIVVVGTTGYFLRTGGAQEFSVINLANPASVSVIGGTAVTGIGREVAVVGSYAYIASNDNSQELVVVNISNPAAPSSIGSYNASGNDDAISIAAFGSTVLIGKQSGILYVVSVATPSVPSLLGTYNGTSDIFDIDLGNNDTYAFLVTDSTTQEFIVVNITNPAAPAVLGSVNLPGIASGVSYNQDLDRAFATTISNTAELVVIQPN